jgi:hypothetical protein
MRCHVMIRRRAPAVSLAGPAGWGTQCEFKRFLLSSPELLLRVPAWKGTAGNAVGSDGPPVRGAPYSDDWSDIHAAESSPQGRLVWILYGVRP